jgi:hypothetical protein
LPKGIFVEASVDIFLVGLSITLLGIFLEVGIFPVLLLGIFLGAHSKAPVYDILFTMHN